MVEIVPSDTESEEMVNVDPQERRNTAWVEFTPPTPGAKPEIVRMLKKSDVPKVIYIRNSGDLIR